MLIKQTPEEITIETRRASNREILSYKLDGSETTTQGITCRAHWDGSKLIIGTTRNVQDSTITTLQEHTLDPTGRELTIHKTLTVQHGYQFEGAKSSGSGTDVFVKAKPSAAK